MKRLLLVVALCPVLALADDSAGTVQVPSLKVKDRLHSIEQIVVSAEKEQVAEAPESNRVAQLLEEARQLDESETDDQSAAH